MTSDIAAVMIGELTGPEFRSGEFPDPSMFSPANKS